MITLNAIICGYVLKNMYTVYNNNVISFLSKLLSLVYYNIHFTKEHQFKPISRFHSTIVKNIIVASVKWIPRKFPLHIHVNTQQHISRYQHQ